MAHSQHKISIPLCTYNGERFLPQQLASIVQQTRLPDELIVCDDGSSDQTVRITRDFAASASFPVRISKNDNLGFVANFERAIRLCGGDRITLCDQDDIWYPNRFERTEQEFNAHPEVGLVFSDGDLIDDQDRLQATRLWPRFSFAGKRKGQNVCRRLHRSGKESICDLRNRHLPPPLARDLFAGRVRLAARRVDRRHPGRGVGSETYRLTTDSLSPA
jgi:glycosyltransferase involved in cell wall biosynthesis